MLQRQPTAGATQDRWEREADEVAQRVSRGEPAPSLSPVTAGSLGQERDAGPELGAPAAEVRPAGGGRPLAEDVRATLEPGLGTDLSAVRVHDDAAARQTADAWGARAVTRGTDVLLGSGQSDRDVPLLAHEAAHVVQQASGDQVLQRADGDGTGADPPASAAGGAPAPGGGSGSGSGQVIDLGGGNAIEPVEKHLTVASIAVPTVKETKTKQAPPTKASLGEREDTVQATEWPKAVAASAGPLVEAKKTEIAQAKSEGVGNLYYLIHETAPLQPIVVTPTALERLAVRPAWDEQGRPTSFDIDHEVETQLGGPDDPTNYWLLEEQANRSSGSKIMHQVRRKIDALLRKAGQAGVTDVPADRRAAGELGWTFSVTSVEGGLGITGEPDRHWGLAQIQQGAHFARLRPMSPDEMLAAGGSQEELVLFLGPEGGHRQEVPWGAAAPDGQRDLPGSWFALNSRRPRRANGNYRMSKLEFDPVNGGRVVGVLFERGAIEPVPKDIAIAVHEPIPWAGFLEKEDFLNYARTRLHLKNLSPIVLDELDLVPEKGLVGHGRLMPTVPLISEAEIDVVIDGTDVYLSKAFTADDFSFPGPVVVGDCSLELRLGTQGFAILGEAAITVEGVGNGRIFGEAGATPDEVRFALGGEFDFLSDLFDPARVELSYRDGQFSGRGELGIPEGKVTGLRSANVVVAWSEGVLSADGTFATDIPGVESGTLAFVYGEDGTVELSGTLALGSEVPGIRSGSIAAQLIRGEDGAWSVLGQITAVPSLPGVTSQITGVYENGAVQVEAALEYARGMASGQLVVGLTNQPLDDTGRPTGEPGDDVVVYGRGSVELAIAPWLRAGAGLRILPDGTVEVSGEIGLPDALELFPQKAFERELFRVALDIPIFGVAAAGQQVGIFARIGGGAVLRAHVGPAQLQDLSLGVTWRPDDEASTAVVGQARLHLPAGVGVRLDINAGVGAGIPLVSVVLGLEIGGELGIEAAVGAGVEISWTPGAGLVLDAVAEAAAEPVFRFDLAGFVKVELDLVVDTVTLLEERWQLAAFEFGSGLRLGLRMPVHYEEGQPFEPSFDDLQLEVPDIDPLELLTGLIDQIA